MGGRGKRGEERRRSKMARVHKTEKQRRENDTENSRGLQRVAQEHPSLVGGCCQANETMRGLREQTPCIRTGCCMLPLTRPMTTPVFTAAQAGCGESLPGWWRVTDLGLNCCGRKA